MEFWQNIYSHFNPVAFSIGDIAVHWYGIMYALALLSAIFIAKWFIKYDNINISQDIFDSYIWWAEIGVILLMFGVGLHFSWASLLRVKKIAIPGAVCQILIATLCRFLRQRSWSYKPHPWGRAVMCLSWIWASL